MILGIIIFLAGVVIEFLYEFIVKDWLEILFIGVFYFVGAGLMDGILETYFDKNKK